MEHEIKQIECLMAKSECRRKTFLAYSSLQVCHFHKAVDWLSTIYVTKSFNVFSVRTKLRQCQIYGRSTNTCHRIDSSRDKRRIHWWWSSRVSLLSPVNNRWIHLALGSRGRVLHPSTQKHKTRLLRYVNLPHFTFSNVNQLSQYAHKVEATQLRALATLQAPDMCRIPTVHDVTANLLKIANFNFKHAGYKHDKMLSYGGNFGSVRPQNDLSYDEVCTPILDKNFVYFCMNTATFSLWNRFPEILKNWLLVNNDPLEVEKQANTGLCTN